jgi:hypothetical protein
MKQWKVQKGFDSQKKNRNNLKSLTYNTYHKKARTKLRFSLFWKTAFKELQLYPYL